MIYIGIDPGVSGGIAALTDSGSVLAAIAMPETTRDMVVALRCFGHDTVAILERVHASPQMGVTSAFTFGRGYGRLEAALTAAEIPFDLVTPQRWQGVLGCMSHGQKNITKARAQGLFPLTKITHAIADALLIAEFCRRLHRGSNGKEEQAGHPSTETGTRGAPQGGEQGDTKSPVVTFQGGRRHGKAEAAREGQHAAAAGSGRRLRAGR